MGVICGKPKDMKDPKKVIEANGEKEKNGNPEIDKANNNKETQVELEKLQTGDTSKDNNNKDNKINQNPTNCVEEKKKEEQAEKNEVEIDAKMMVPGGDGNPRDKYLRKKILGQGSFGTVYLVKHKELYKYFAMKVIKKSNKNKEEEQSLMNEINILRGLDHPNILKITDFYSLKNEYNIITEYCQEGELFDEIKANAPFSETMAGWYMKQIFSAVNFCHKSHIVHRDLKPENILIEKRVKSGLHPIKIIDFGTAKVFHKEKQEHMLIGSAYYIAPEVLSRKYNEQCDNWSCGVIMYILLTGRPPFNGSNEQEIMDKIKIGKYEMEKYPWGIISQDAKDLIRSLLQVDPNKRYTAEAALSHPWFRSEKVMQSECCNNIKAKSLNKLLDNLTKYKSDNVLRCAVIAYLVHHSTQLNQAHDAIKLFNKIDKNGDGKITREELFDGLQQFLKLSGQNLKTQVDIIFNNIDTDHNNYIEYEEFVRAAIDKSYFLSDNFLKFAFNFLDRDGNGNITLEEVKNIFYQNEKNKNSYKAQEQLEKSFKEIDVNGDGVLSFQEFVQMMEKIIQKE